MYEEQGGKGIIPIRPKWRIEILDQNELENFHQATVNILNSTGIHYPSQHALEIFSDAGAEVDFDRQIVKLSNTLIEKALQKAPRSYELSARDKPQLNLELKGDKQTYFATSGAASKVIDLESGSKRPPRKEDLRDIVKIADYLPYISFQYGPLVTPQDVPGEVAPLHELNICLNCSCKHFQSVTLTEPRLANYAVEMASVVAGGQDQLRNTPILSALICTVSPLAQDKDSIEAALVFAKAGVPVGFMAMPTMGTTAPASQAGSLVLGNAEILSAITLIQLAYPGAPVFYALVPAVSDRKTGEYFYGSPLAQVENAAATQLAHFYGVPILNGASFAGSGNELDAWQVGRENVYLPLLSALCGADLAVGMGLMEEVNVLHPRRIIFDNEIFQAANQICSSIEVKNETLLTEVIHEVGPLGHFLAQRHTRDHLGDLWPPSILHEHSAKSEKRFRDPKKVAQEKLKWIQKNHEPKPLEKNIRLELQRLLDTATKELTKNP